MRGGVIESQASSSESDEVADEQVGEDRVAARDHVVGALDDARAARRSAPRVAGPVPAAGSVSSVPWTRSIGQRDRAADGLDRRSVEMSNGAACSASIASTEPSSAQPTASSIAFVEWGSEVISAKKNRAKSGVVAPPVVAVVLRPALVGRQLVVERGDAAA